jgi:hypothetical protein
MHTPAYTISAKTIELVARIAEKAGERFCGKTLKPHFHT